MPITSRFAQTTARRDLQKGDLFFFDDGGKPALGVWGTNGHDDCVTVLSSPAAESELPATYFGMALPRLARVVHGEVSIEPLKCDGLGTPSSNFSKAGSVWMTVDGDIRVRAAGLSHKANWWSLLTGEVVLAAPSPDDMIYDQWCLTLRRPGSDEVIELMRWPAST